MKSVIAEVDPEWDGFTQDDGDVVGMLARVRVSNHGAELVRSLIVTMHHRETGGTYSSKFVPALPAVESQVFAVPRILGLYEDQPFPEEEVGWEGAYWFEVLFVDLADKRWVLQFSPRDNYQYVRRAWS